MGMEEEQYNDAFHMENDYEGLVELGGEFFFRQKKKKRQQTEEERLYGYISSDDDSDGGGRRRGKKPKADYSKPVGFVSSGVIVQQPDDSTPAVTKAPAAAAAGAGAAAVTKGGADRSPRGAGHKSGGLGYSTAGLGSSSAAGLGSSGREGGGGGGLGFVSAGGGGGVGSSNGGLGFRAAMAGGEEEGEDEADEHQVLPTAFGRKVRAAAEQRKQQQAAARSADTSRNAARAADPKFATFEAHTKGIGSKLLEKMGYKPGQGLGRTKQGIAKPLEPKMRPKGMGMGFGDFTEAKMEMPGAKKEEEEEAAAAPDQAATAAAGGAGGAQMWKKRAAPARQKLTYKTAEEVLADAADKPSGAQPILDMRGPQARLVTDMDQLNVEGGAAGAAGAAGGPPMPELQHNVALLVSLTEAQLQKLDARLQHEQDTAALLVKEKERLQQELEAHTGSLQRLAELTNAVARCQVQSKSAGLTLDQLHATYSGLQANYPVEYQLYQLPMAALPLVLPRLRSQLVGWAPLQEPLRAASEFARWRRLLESESARQRVLGDTAAAAAAGSDHMGWSRGGGLGSGEEDAYAALVWELVVPPVRSAITGWEPRHPEALLSWLDVWGELLPPTVRTHLLTTQVMPRIAAAVEGWEPRQETVPIHSWLHPWLPYLAAELEQVYPGIRHKLSLALSAWHPSDASAALLLGPWQPVFDRGDWEALLGRSIVPQLGYALQELVINPVAQQLELFQWVLAWHGLLSNAALAGLMEEGFFPKWHGVLHHWLSSPSPNQDEITRWYLGWKGLFPQDLLDHPRVRLNFNHALNMMNSAAEGAPLPPLAAMGPPPSSASAAAAAAGNGQAEWGGGRGAGSGAGKGGASSAEPTLRELVERYAADAGVEFLPRPGRYQDGLQVYSFGGVSCVLETGGAVIRAQVRERWAPVSLARLLELAAAKQRGVPQ